jgi:oligosaccharyltransferase complex subunit gamma
MRWTNLALLFLPFCLAATKQSPQEELAALAAAGNGDIRILDERTFDLLTAPHRNWSAAIQFTALDKRRRCAPCK